MKITWQNAFSHCDEFVFKKNLCLKAPDYIRSLNKLKSFLDYTQVKHGLLKPYFELEHYPLVESRELLPSFEADLYEHKELPGFSQVVLNRRIDSFQEIFQFDVLHSLLDASDITLSLAKGVAENASLQNLQTIQQRLPKNAQEDFKALFAKQDVTDIRNYPRMLEFLLQMERAQVMALDEYGNFHLAGVFASLPTDLDTEIKRFGLRMGKFAIGDTVRYEQNRLFVYQFLMELYGFPIVSERRTSAALFARRLHKLGEQFMVRVLGQSDRVITSLSSHPSAKNYPLLEKIALVRVDKEQHEVIDRLKQGGFFLDPRQRIVILRVVYRQHKYNTGNVRQERALSVDRQEVIHPLTGKVSAPVNIIKDTYNMFLRLNDIVRGEYAGRVVYKRHEVVENTDTDEKRLKFLYAWLSKNQRRVIGYSDDFYANVVKVLDNYLLNPDNYETFKGIPEPYREVWAKYSFIQQARKVRLLEDLSHRTLKGTKLNYLEMLIGACELLHELRFEIVDYFDDLVSDIIFIGDNILGDKYLKSTYVEKKDEDMSNYGREIKKLYRRLVSLTDAFKSYRKTKRPNQGDNLLKAG